ncbi:unnamed protein product [Anisakis simplex]|uniref:Transcription repressor n=1 Tax=Anisakis simplex TaxID=6269 RepID=A0A0M3K254_ANISI|nr:unnamed protein product [Anisakis simplex]
MSGSGSFSYSLNSTSSSSSPSRFAFGPRGKAITKSPSAFSANEMKKTSQRPKAIGNRNSRSHSRMRHSRTTDDATSMANGECSHWQRNYSIDYYRNKCANEFDEQELDSFMEWLMERRRNRGAPKEGIQLAEDDHLKRIEQIRSILFK